MSEYIHVEKPFLEQLAVLGWTAIDQGVGIIPSDPAPSLRNSFREWMLPAMFHAAVRAINSTEDGKPWLTDRQSPRQLRRRCCLTRRTWPKKKLFMQKSKLMVYIYGLI